MKILMTTDQIKAQIPYVDKKSNSHNIIACCLNIIRDEIGNDNDYRKHLERFLPQLEDIGWEHLFMDETYN